MIVSYEIVEQTIQSGGTQRVYVAFTDHLAQVHHRSYDFPSGAVVADEIAIRQTAVESGLESAEVELLTSAVESGSIVAMDVEPVLPSTDTLAVRKRKFYRRLLRYVVNNRDIKLARLVFYPVWYYLKFESEYTAQQIADYLDISLAKLAIINSRFQAIHDNLTFVDTDDDYVSEVD